MHPCASKFGACEEEEEEEEESRRRRGRREITANIFPSSEILPWLERKQRKEGAQNPKTLSMP
jgi:hypothetical protein